MSHYYPHIVCPWSAISLQLRRQSPNSRDSLCDSPKCDQRIITLTNKLVPLRGYLDFKILRARRLSRKITQASLSLSEWWAVTKMEGLSSGRECTTRDTSRDGNWNNVGQILSVKINSYKPTRGRNETISNPFSELFNELELVNQSLLTFYGLVRCWAWERKCKARYCWKMALWVHSNKWYLGKCE